MPRYMDHLASQQFFLKRAFRLGFFMVAGLGLSGCVTMLDPYGHSSVSVGVGYRGGDYYDPYYGWYDDFYYPGNGYYIYDRRGHRHRWNDRHRRYWLERRSGVREIRENWAGYTRGGDGYYSDQRREARRDRREIRRERREERRDRRTGRDSGFADDSTRRAAVGTVRERRQLRREDRRQVRQERGSDATSESPVAQPQTSPPVRAKRPESRVVERQVRPAHRGKQDD